MRKYLNIDLKNQDVKIDEIDGEDVIVVGRHLIAKILLEKDIATVVWLKDCPYPFVESSPPPVECTWAGVLYKDDIPYRIWEYCEERKKDTWRKY